MFDDDVRRLVQVASIANAVGAADNAAPWRALLWLAGQVEAGTLAARLFIPVRMRGVDTARGSRDESLAVWRGMAKRVSDALTGPRLKLDQRDSYLPSAASTWHVHVNDLLQFIDAAEMHSAVRAELRELAQRYRGAADEPPILRLDDAGTDEATACLLNGAHRETVATTKKVHRIRRRADPLAAFINHARATAPDQTDWTSVWATMVVLAQQPDRMPPLLGYVDGEGIKYQSENAESPVGWLTRQAWRRRASRAT